MIRNIFIPALTALMISVACNNAPKGDTATITDKKEASDAKGMSFTVDTTASMVRFTGHGVGKNHIGTFHLSSGNVAVAGNQITGGDFIINIKSIALEEKGEMFEKKLKPHLLSGDFFDAEKFGTAKFEITKVTPYTADGKDSSIVKGANYNISGNLTLKGTTKNITFPAKVDLDDNSLKANGNFDIDRRQWQMNYGNDKTLGDKFISETVNIVLDLQAKKS